MIAEPPSRVVDGAQTALIPLDARIVTALDIAVALVTTALMAMANVGATGESRVVLALAFVTFVPGWALLDHVTLVDGGAARLAVSVALSLTISTIAALGLLWLHLWHPIVLFDVLGAISLLAVVMHLRGSEAAQLRPSTLTKGNL